MECLALRTVRYDDRRAIVSAWSRSHGRVAFIVPDGASPSARRRRALMMPLGLFEGECDVRPGASLLTIRDVRPLAVLPSLAADPAKAVVAMFLTEVLERVLRDNAPDDALTDYLFRAVGWLDATGSAAAVANFPLIFLTHLAAMLGIAPVASGWRRGRVLDLDGGVFRDTPPLQGHWLEAPAAAMAARLLRCSFAASARWHLPRALRRQALDTVLQYYSLHHTPMAQLRSLDVVAAIF